jgi:Ca2+-transporting ATPase
MPTESHSGPGGFLTVPGAGVNSRGNSIESPSEGDETLVPYPVVSNTATAKSGNEDDDDPLRPHGADNPAEFNIENNVFAFSPGQLGKLYNPKSHAALKALGGMSGLEYGLRTDRKAGLSIDETTLDGVVTFRQAIDHHRQPEPGGKETLQGPEPIEPTTTNGTTANLDPKDLKSSSYADRRRVFGNNTLPAKKAKNIFQLMWIAFLDKVLLLLTGAAVISLALGLYQTFGIVHKEGEGASVEWVEGVAIMVAIVIVVVVGAGNDYQKERQFVKLNKKVMLLYRMLAVILE